VTKRLRLTLTADAETASATITFTRLDERKWQATTAFAGTSHATVGHPDEQAALLSITRWLRGRFNVPPGATTVVGIAGVLD
jgi:hypothetical protein